MPRVTDPELLQQLESSAPEPRGRMVTDPALLQQLNTAPNDVAPPQPPLPPRQGGYPTAHGQVDAVANPGLTGYAWETGRAVARGAGQMGTSAIKGFGALSTSMLDPALAESMTNEQLAQLMDEQKDVSQNLAYKGGEALEGYLPKSRKILNPIVEDVASGFGSLFGGIGLGVLSPVLAGSAYGLAGAGEAADNAIQAKANPDQQRLASALGVAPGLLDTADLFLSQIGGPAKALGLLTKIGKAAFVEGLQEGGQQWIQNLISRGVYDPNKDISPLAPDVAYNALIGALVGGGYRAAISPFDKAPTVAPSQSDIDAALGNVPNPNGVAPPQSAGATSQGPTEPPPPGPPGAPPATQVPPLPTTGFDIQTGPTGEPPQAKPGEFDELNPPPAEPPPRDEMKGPQRIDLGFGHQLIKDQSGWKLIDDTGKTLTTALTFADISLKAKDYLETGVLATPTAPPISSVSPSTTTPPTATAPPSTTPAPAGGSVVAGPTPGETQYVAKNGAKFGANQAKQAAYNWLVNERKMTAAEIKEGRAPFGDDVVRFANSLGWDLFTPAAPTKKGEKKLPPVPANTLPADVVEFMARVRPQISAPEPAAPTETEIPSKEEQTIEVRPGANQKRVRQILGTSLYGDLSQAPEVTMKELFQNAYDAIRNMLSSGAIDQGQITITTDQSKRSIIFHDNGEGMTPETLGGPFLEIAGTQKSSDKSTGGYGVAKLVTLYANNVVKVITMKNGVVSRMATTGEQLSNAMDGEGELPKIDFGPATEQEQKLFPQGHGTVVQVTIPEKFQTPDGEIEDIYFPYDMSSYRVLKHSPLLSNVTVALNNRVIEGVGATFKAEDHAPVVDVKFPWGTARVYATKDPLKEPVHNNLHVLINGLWQLDSRVSEKPGDPYAESAPYEFYLDMFPNVKAGQPGYPVAPNRQDFAPSVRQDMAELVNHLSIMYAFESLKDDVASFGTMSYIDADGKRSNSTTIEPKRPAQTPLATLKKGDKVVVKDGKFSVGGKAIPLLDIKKIHAERPDFDTLKVDQKEIDSKRVMLHDNTYVKLSDVEKKSIVDLAVEKYGQRFIDFVNEIGREFILLRDALASSDYSKKSNRWKGITDIAIGVSFDTNYRGVSVVTPFQGAFVNIAVPEVTEPLLGGLGFFYTMIHELAHFMQRNHNASHSVEMQAILAAIDSHTEYDVHAAKSRIVAAYAKNNDIFNYINGFYSGAHTIIPRGNRFKDSGTYEARDASGIVARAQAGRIGGPPAGVDQSGGAREAIAGQASDSTGFGRTFKEGGIADSLREQRSNTRNLQQLDPELTAAYPIEEHEPLKQAVAAGGGGANTGGGGGTPGTPSAAGRGGTAQLGIHADGIGKRHKYLWGLDRLVDLHPRFTPLLRYAERIREMRLDTSRWHDAGLRIVRQWRRLPQDQIEGLTAFIDDITNMAYRSINEQDRGVVRHPSPQEFTNLVNKHKLGKAALEVYSKQKQFFEIFLDEITKNAVESAQRNIQDPNLLIQKIDEITARKDNLLARPYFPFTRFGTHFVTVKDSAGRVKFFQTYERKGLSSAEKQQQAAFKRIDAAKASGDVVTQGVLPETAAPFVGLPPEMLESIANELQLTGAQRDALDQLRYQFSPAASFSHHWQNKNYTPGYSHDFIRAFSRYAFHGGRYYSRVKYAWALRDEISAARAIPGNQAGTIANYMEDHLQNTVLDAKGDFGLFKGAIFLWVFGYAPIGAFVNLSQTPLITYPFLAAKFGGAIRGDTVAARAIAKATAQLNSFYKKGYYDNQSAFELKAMDYGIKTGRISEAMASDLAGLAAGDGLISFGNNKVQRGFTHFLEKAAWMFEMAEQMNRRVAFRAALDLATRYPNAVAVKEALNKYADEYQQLQTGRYSFSPSEAAAVVTAAYTVEQTQFTYSRETRPRFMRGRLAGTIFVFKTYMLNVLQLLGANKSSVMPRYLLMMLATAGLMGLPGADDMADIAQLLGKWFFGKDFNVRLALRQLILDLGKGNIPPDVILHGLARKGMGLPALVDLLGEHPGRGLGGAPDSPETQQAYLRYAAELRAKQGIPGSYEEFRKQHSQNVPFPSTDLSKSLGMGRILPFNLGNLLDPRGNDANTGIAGALQEASGAVFSVGFNLYKALQDSQQDEGDLKRWEKAMPRAASSLSRSYRAYYEGKERARGTGPNGSPIVMKYDARDTEHMMEIFALMGGFMPSRLSAQWDSVAAQQEVQSKFKFERQAIMGQMFEAVTGGNPDEIDRARDKLLKFNDQLPDWAASMKIGKDALDQSIHQRMRAKVLREAGVPVQRSMVPIARHVQDLFPESVVDVRPLD